MTKSTITRERLQEIAEDGFLKHGESKELARMALAAMDSEPVAWMSKGGTVLNGMRQSAHDFAHYNIPLYRHAQPAVDSDFIPKNLDKALGVLGMAIPESREEFNFQTERWIQRLIDRVIRYADEFQEQPAPIVPEEMPEHTGPREFGRQQAYVDGWNACRASMLQSEPVTTANKLGNSPAQSDCCPAQNQGWIQVSEQMPGRYYVLAADFSGRHYPPSQPNTQVGIHDDWFGDGKPTWDGGDGNDLHLKQVTHWMPLPDAPQEVSDA